MNKKVLITGTSGAIGHAIQEELIASGYSVYGCGRRKSQDINYLSVDISTPDACRELVLEAQNFLGGIDILINNAGIYQYSYIENMKFEDIQKMTNINFITPYFLTSLVIPYMKQNKWGRIVNIGSISGAIGEGGATLYSATKSALMGFTKALALEVAMDNITVNTINPGWVETPLAESAVEQSDLTLDENIDVIPQKRFIEPCEIAYAVKYLISEEAKGLTGQSINLCAGLSVG